MRTIGLIGGMSWESTALYYKLINERVRDRMGKLHSAPLLMYSYDFQEIKEMQYAGRWQEAASSLAEVAQRLESAGARAIVLCTNTMHKLAPEIVAKLTIPFVHIGDSTAQRIRSKGYRRVGLLGTKFTMEEDFYIDRLRAHDLDVLVPPAEARADVNRIIYDELCLGNVARPLALPLSGGDGGAGRPWCRVHHPRLHRDHDARRAGRHDGRDVRHDGDPRRDSG
ncbi:aspartate racemase [Bradyrhizobium diazoefficiens]